MTNHSCCRSAPQAVEQADKNSASRSASVEARWRASTSAMQRHRRFPVEPSAPVSSSTSDGSAERSRSTTAHPASKEARHPASKPLSSTHRVSTMHRAVASI
eukprot:2337413-Prymnesium_polylepis.1